MVYRRTGLQIVVLQATLMTFTSRKSPRGSSSKLPLTFCLLSSALFALLFSTWAFAQEKSKANQAASGKEAFSANCAGCHGLDGKGGERAPDIATRPQVRQLSDEAILQVLQKGVPNSTMPSFGFLDLKTRQSLVAYLRTLQGAVPATKLPGDAHHGREVFFGKGGCATCHMVRG